MISARTKYVVAEPPKRNSASSVMNTVKLVVIDRPIVWRIEWLTISANGSPAGAPLPVTGDWQTVEYTVDKQWWRAGVNTLTLRFAYARRPADVGAGGDVRPLAAAIDWLRISVNSSP